MGDDIHLQLVMTLIGMYAKDLHDRHRGVHLHDRDRGTGTALGYTYMTGTGVHLHDRHWGTLVLPGLATSRDWLL